MFTKAFPWRFVFLRAFQEAPQLARAQVARMEDLRSAHEQRLAAAAARRVRAEMGLAAHGLGPPGAVHLHPSHQRGRRGVI